MNPPRCENIFSVSHMDRVATRCTRDDDDEVDDDHDEETGELDSTGPGDDQKRKNDELKKLFKVKKRTEIWAFKEEKKRSVEKVEKGSFRETFEDFLRSEDQMVRTTPACGGCRCGHCPQDGCQFTMKGEIEYKRIKDNLEKKEGRWYADLPWKNPEDDRKALNMDLAEGERVMKQVEKSLVKKEGWKDSYNEQIKEMIDREVVKEVSEEEFEAWKEKGGSTFFLPHFAVEQPGKSTPIRIVWDASRKQAGGKKRMNDYLNKGPDGLVNDLSSILLDFRSHRHASICDVKKMHNRVLLNEPDQYMQLEEL